MKLAFFAPTAELNNGWGVVAAQICKILVKKYSDQIDLKLYLPAGEEKKGYVAGSVLAKHTHYTLPPFAWSFRNPRRLLQYLTTDALVEKPDLIHALDFPYAFSALKSSAGKIPYVITLAGTFYKPLYKFPDQYIFNKVYKNAANINAPSEFTMNLAKEDFALPDSKTSVISNGVDFVRFSAQSDLSELRAKYGNDKKIILGVGALKKRKGFDVVIKAMKKVVEKVPDAIYIIVGSGSNEGELQNLVNELNLEKQVFFAGRVNDKDLPSYFQLCDVYSHAPRATDGAYPGFEMVYVEAGCAGKPVVGAKSGGTPSAVIDGETGYLVPEEDVDSLAERLVEILQDKELANRFAECNKQFAKERDWKNIVGQHVDLYKSLLFDKI